MNNLNNYKSFEAESDSGDCLRLLFIKRNKAKEALMYTWFILSFGLFYILHIWIVKFQLLSFDICAPYEATHVVVTAKDRSRAIRDITPLEVPLSALDPNQADHTILLQTFTFRFIRYYFSMQSHTFSALKYSCALPCKDVHEKLGEGITSDAQYQGKLRIFGACLIDVPMPTIWELLYREILHPFFIFQVFSIVLWCVEKYFLYSLTILILSVVSVLSNLFETKRNIKAVREMALYECMINVKRENKWIVANSTQLVPGDLIEIPENIYLPCDVVLLSGIVLVDESMLTGESQPVLKDPLPKGSPQIYRGDKRHTLSSGTKPLNCRGNSYGIVIATGFSTAKGELVRSILFPKPNRFKFISETFKYIGMMGILAILGFFYCLGTFMEENIPVVNIILLSLDLITIAVPPALPLAMTIGTTFAINRLKKKNVNCISPHAVNPAGRVSIICFDKTGTLTEDHMTLKGVYDASTNKIESNLDNCVSILQESMATCHSLTTINGEMYGDPQEIAIFRSIGWESKERDGIRSVIRNDGDEIKIKHLFHFSQITKRMGVIIEAENQLKLHLKGAPEEICKLCASLPENISHTILHFSRQGYRLLACAYKNIESYSSDQQLGEIENDLIFLGLILLQNELKPDSTDVIGTLQSARVRCVMSTGDAILTGSAVGKLCGIIPGDSPVFLGDINGEHIVWEDEEGDPKDWTDITGICCLSITGNLLEFLIYSSHPSLPYVLSKGAVFGRMSPQQKIMLVEQMQKDDTLVAMVGDGANDCGALKGADVGLSLSEAEASIAAPFSSKDLRGIIEILKEGRASLVTCFQSFKFITMYSMIQFLCVMILYTLHNSLQDAQFLYQDLFMILPLAIFMAYTAAYNYLSPVMPPGALISVPVVSSILGQILISLTMLITGYLTVHHQDWFVPTESTVEHPKQGPENTVLFILASTQILIVCMSFSIGPPYRQPAYANYWFSSCVVIVWVISVYFTLTPDTFTRKLLAIYDMPMDFKEKLLGIMFANLVIAWAYEKLGVRVIMYCFKKIKERGTD
ncbi:unnamed protein product [Blepharisma stoltei]|uniref:P-type ATPase A domain-containing protein n=1 Tax=Blepharisma stoltei TaxID=1481888 RepID=A0AAU9J8K7_9CILI|nr:unnamed protein product [Blepharisma stoltei]